MISINEIEKVEDAIAGWREAANSEDIDRKWFAMHVLANAVAEMVASDKRFQDAVRRKS
jgi:hypothetical protein